VCVKNPYQLNYSINTGSGDIVYFFTDVDASQKTPKIVSENNY